MCVTTIWKHFGNHFGMRSQYLRDNFGMILKECSDRLGPFWDHFGMSLGSCRDHFGIIVGVVHHLVTDSLSIWN